MISSKRMKMFYMTHEVSNNATHTFQFQSILMLIKETSSTEHILEDSYHGLIKENETFVEITPLIKVDEDKVCRLEIVKSQKDVPFKVKICRFQYFFMLQ